jgi:hypothetical protein
MPQANDRYNGKLSKDKKMMLDKETDGTILKIREIKFSPEVLV